MVGGYEMVRKSDPSARRFAISIKLQFLKTSYHTFVVFCLSFIGLCCISAHVRRLQNQKSQSPGQTYSPRENTAPLLPNTPGLEWRPLLP